MHRSDADGRPRALPRRRDEHRRRTQLTKGALRSLERRTDRGLAHPTVLGLRGLAARPGRLRLEPPRRDQRRPGALRCRRRGRDSLVSPQRDEHRSVRHDQRRTACVDLRRSERNRHWHERIQIARDSALRRQRTLALSASRGGSRRRSRTPIRSRRRASRRSTFRPPCRWSRTRGCWGRRATRRTSLLRSASRSC